MIDSGEKLPELDASQAKALTALLSCPTVAAAAKRARLGEATLYRYLRDDVFKSHYRAARSEIVEHAIVGLQRDCAVAARCLREVCESESAPASARVAAANSILSHAIKAVELQDMAARLEALEAKEEKDDEQPGQHKKTNQTR